MKKLMVTAAMLLVAGSVVAMDAPTVIPEKTVTPPPSEIGDTSKLNQTAPTEIPLTEKHEKTVEPVLTPKSTWGRRTATGGASLGGATLGGFGGYKAASYFTDKPCVRVVSAVVGTVAGAYASYKLVAPKKETN